MRAFFDITIGDVDVYNTQQEEWQRGLAFYTEVGSQYGLTDSLNQLDDDAREILNDAASANPKWTASGSLRLTPPGDIHAGRIVVELFENVAPKTVENFRCLVTGEKGLGKSSKKPLHYKCFGEPRCPHGTHTGASRGMNAARRVQNCRFHRIVTSFCCQGGDVVKGDGSSGDSIYGGKFNDEREGLKLKHDAAGVLSMANSGKNSNSSQFFFTLAPAPQCDGKHVVFGRVVEGIEILHRIGVALALALGTYVNYTVVGPWLCSTVPILSGYMAIGPYVWAALYVAVGISHFTNHAIYLRFYPHQGAWGFWKLPGSPSFHVNWTGAAEILGGLGMLLGAFAAPHLPFLPPWLSQASAFGLMLLTYVVSPANFYMVSHNSPGLFELADVKAKFGSDNIPAAVHAMRFVTQLVWLSTFASAAFP